MRRSATLLFLTVLLAGSQAHATPSGTKTRIQGATQVRPAAWGLVAQGSGQLRILPSGSSKWQTVHKVDGDTLYRVAFDEAGRLLAAWEKEPYFHLFVPKQNQHLTFAKPPAPSAEFKYGFTLEDFFFTKDGAGAIVYMHGFLGGRTWSTVAYHYTLDRRSEPTLLYRQSGYALRTTSRLAVYALPKDVQNACDGNSCHPLGEIVGWEISGAKATKKILLSAGANNNLSRVRPVWGNDEERIAVVVTEHPRKRHLLRWRWGEAKASFGPLPPGPGADPEDVRLTSFDELVETWLTAERGLEIKRHSARGEVKVSSVAPLPRRTPNDRPLFDVSGSMERKNGDFILHWGEYLVLLPLEGPARRLDLRSLFKGISEFAGLVIYVAEPEGFWIGLDAGRALDLLYLSFADVQKEAQ